MPTLKPKGVCDFCPGACNADMRGAKAYDCTDFQMEGGHVTSQGAWAACPACAALVDAEKWDELVERMAAGQQQTAEHFAGRAVARRMAPQIRMTCKRNVEAFIRNRSLGKYGVN